MGRWTTAASTLTTRMLTHLPVAGCLPFRRSLHRECSHEVAVIISRRPLIHRWCCACDLPTVHSWQQLRDALNATGRPIYTEFCPRSFGGSLVPPNKTTQDCDPGQRCINDGPPHEWDAQTRSQLANAILTEFGNSHDSWGSAMSNLDALLSVCDCICNDLISWQQ